AARRALDRRRDLGARERRGARGLPCLSTRLRRTSAMSTSRKWRFAGINFDHQHMGDLLRQVHEHPNAEIVGISDEQPERMQYVTKTFNIPKERVFTDYKACC